MPAIRGWGGEGGAAGRLGLLLAVALAGCATAPVGGPSGAPDGCRIESPPGSGGVPRVGLTGEVDPRRAPLSGNDAEGLLFATLHPPLLVRDCSGVLRPALVREWQEAEGGREWILRTVGAGVEGAGAESRARRVALRLAMPEAWGAGMTPISVEVHAPAEVRVRFAEPLPDGASTFAIRELAPVPSPEDAPPGAFATGLSGLRLEREGVASRETGVVLGLRDGDGRTLARIQVLPSGDPRSLLDGGAELVLTRDAEAVSWGRTRRPAVRVVPLPPDRVYLLALPAGQLRDLPRGLLEELARDVVPGGSPAAPGGWVSSPSPCPLRASAGGDVLPGARPAPGSARLVVPAGDAVATALAERVAALVAPGGHPSLQPLRAGGTGVPEGAGAGAVLRVASMGPGDFGAALRSGRDAAYLLSLPRSPAAPCRARMELEARLSWLGAGGTLVPLVESGATALLRPGSPVLEFDAAGALRIVGEAHR